MRNQPTKIITHHALSRNSHTHKDVQQWHKTRWDRYNPSPNIAINGEPSYIGYHVIIEWDGTIVKCREYNEEGVHCRGQNFSSIGVCFMGNFDVHHPSKAQLDAWKQWYLSQGNKLPVYPHRNYATKSCHGALLDDSFFSDIVKREYYIKRIEQLKMLISKLQSLLLQRRMK